ncbi:MAG: tetratricopeptide repeat protein [Bryobacterales bacterium]|nr:tetratricopeptide repeat protein [Bryobacterales bacterium]
MNRAFWQPNHRVRLATVGVVLLGLALMAPGQTPRAISDWKRPLIAARDGQDVTALQKLTATPSPAGHEGSPPLEFRLALAYSYLSEVHLEKGNKPDAAKAAREGINLARKAIEMLPKNAESHWLLGTLCGQVIPANVLSGLSFGQCARDEIETALRLNPQLPEGYLARGVGNYYLPPAFGGGLEKAEQDFRKAAELAPGWADAHLWLGLVSRRRGAIAEARQHLTTAQRLAPDRAWIRQQLEKTPKPTP